MRALLLSAGKGTRLGNLTKNTPKCLIKINKITLIEQWINKLLEEGVTNILVNTHYQHLKIKNYALIKELSLDFDDDFTVISGDTGSGKSILLNAIGLLFGKRYDKNIINEKKCVIEAIFIINPSFNFFFTNYNLDFDINTIIRREISVEGKSRVFINDTPVTLNKVKELSSHLIEIHSQNESLLINPNPTISPFDTTLFQNDTLQTELDSLNTNPPIENEVIKP